MPSLQSQLEEFLEMLTFETDHPQDIDYSAQDGPDNISTLIQRLQNLSQEERDSFLPLLEKISLKLHERTAQIELQKAMNRRFYLETEAQLRAARTSLMTSLIASQETTS